MPWSNLSLDEGVDMENAIVRIFDGFEAAQQAREALLAEGFAADDVNVSVANDEAGPV